MLYELSRIKQMRKQIGITQTELAKLAGVSQSLVTKIERGTIEPSYSIVKKLFAVLDELISQKQKETVAKQICTKNLISIDSKKYIDYVVTLMGINSISQLPVTKNNVLIGSITESTFIDKYDKIQNKNIKVEEIMDDPFPTLPEASPISLVRDVLKSYPAVILIKKSKPSGIVTKADLLKYL